MGILLLHQIKEDDLHNVGEKVVKLAKLREAFPMPDGFVLQKSIFEDFLRQTELFERIRNIEDSIMPDDKEDLQSKANRIQQLIVSADMPNALATLIIDQYEAMNIDKDKPISDIVADTSNLVVAVRASSIGYVDDKKMHMSFLNINGKERLVKAVQTVFASFYTAKAASYRLKNNITDASIAVLIQKMIPAEASGMIYSTNPTNTEHMLMLVCKGLGSTITNNLAIPDRYIIEKNSLEVVDMSIKRQEHMFTNDEQKNRTVKLELSSRDALGQKITTKQIKEIAGRAKRIENEFNRPQLIEFVVKEDTYYILQSQNIDGLDSLPQDTKVVEEETTEKTTVDEPRDVPTEEPDEETEKYEPTELDKQIMEAADNSETVESEEPKEDIVDEPIDMEEKEEVAEENNETEQETSEEPETEDESTDDEETTEDETEPEDSDEDDTETDEPTDDFKDDNEEQDDDSEEIKLEETEEEVEEPEDDSEGTKEDEEQDSNEEDPIEEIKESSPMFDNTNEETDDETSDDDSNEEDIVEEEEPEEEKETEDSNNETEEETDDEHIAITKDDDEDDENNLEVQQMAEQLATETDNNQDFNIETIEEPSEVTEDELSEDRTFNDEPEDPVKSTIQQAGSIIVSAHTAVQNALYQKYMDKFNEEPTNFQHVMDKLGQDNDIQYEDEIIKLRSIYMDYLERQKDPSPKDVRFSLETMQKFVP